MPVPLSPGPGLAAELAAAINRFFANLASPVMVLLDQETGRVASDQVPIRSAGRFPASTVSVMVRVKHSVADARPLVGAILERRGGDVVCVINENDNDYGSSWPVIASAGDTVTITFAAWPPYSIRAR